MRGTGVLVALIFLNSICCGSSEDVVSAAVPVQDAGCNGQDNCTIARTIVDSNTNKRAQIAHSIRACTQELTKVIEEVRKVETSTNVDKGTQKASVTVIRRLREVNTHISSISGHSDAQLLKDLEDIKKNAKARAEAGDSDDDDDDDGVSGKIEKLGEFTKTLGTNVPTLVKSIDSGDVAQAFKTGFAMVGSILSLIPDPFSQLGGMLFSLISSFISVGKPKKADPFKEIKEDLKDAVNTIQNEFTEKILGEAMGEFKLMMNFYRMHGGVTDQFSEQRWKSLQDVGMTPSSTIGIKEMGTLNKRIGQMLNKNSPDKGKTVYKLIHAFAKLGATRDMVLIKFASLAPIGEAKKNYLESTNLARYRSFERLVCLHTPDDYTISAVHFYYPPGHDSKSHTIYSYVSKLSYEKGYFSKQLEVDVMPEPALVDSGRYLLKEFGTETFVYYSENRVHYAQNEAYKVYSDQPYNTFTFTSEKIEYRTKVLGMPLYMSTAAQEGNKLSIIYKITNKFEESDHAEVSSDLYTSICGTGDFGGECKPIRYVTDSPYPFSKPESAPAFVQGVYNPDGVTSSTDLKVIKIGEEDYSCFGGKVKAPVVVIGDRFSDRFFMQGDEDKIWMKELERESRGGGKYRLKNAFKFTLLEYTMRAGLCPIGP